MPAGVYEPKIEQGVYFKFKVTYTDGSSTAIPLTGYTPKGQIREKANSEEVLAEFQFDMSQAADGIMEVILPPEALKNKVLPVESYDDLYECVYDIEISDGNPENTRRLLQGKAFISPEVTRDG